MDQISKKVLYWSNFDLTIFFIEFWSDIFVDLILILQIYRSNFDQSHIKNCSANHACTHDLQDWGPLHWSSWMVKRAEERSLVTEIRSWYYVWPKLYRLLVLTEIQSIIDSKRNWIIALTPGHSLGPILFRGS